MYVLLREKMELLSYDTLTITLEYSQYFINIVHAINVSHSSTNHCHTVLALPLSVLAQILYTLFGKSTDPVTLKS